MTLDRSTPPPRSGPLEARLPRIERRRLDNGLALALSRANSTPETLVELTLPGGRTRESLGELGVASLVAKALLEGTERLTTVEFVDALDFLGAELRAGVDEDSLVVSLRVLDRHLPAALELLSEALLEPRFDPRDFERLRALRLAAIRTRGEDAARVADCAWDRLMFGPHVSAGHSSLGTESTIGACTPEHARAFHRGSLDPRRTRIALVGKWRADEATDLLGPLVRRWPSAIAATNPPLDQAPSAAPRGLYAVDRPGAPQVELRIGHPSVDCGHPDWLLLAALNYPLGGQFTSRLNLNLRERRGFTYGVRSSFEPRSGPTVFAVSTAVHTQHAAAAIREARAELEGYLSGPTEAELAFTREALEQALARQFETPAARLSFVHTVERFRWPDDYPLERLRRLATLTSTDLAALAREHLHLRELRVLAVGPRDALGELGEAVAELDIDGGPLAGR
jgi:zinc protease